MRILVSIGAFLVLVCISLSSCNRRMWSTCAENGESSIVKNVYVVDTIYIENPIIITLKKQGGSFVLPKKLIDTIKLDMSVLNRPDVYRLDFSFYYGLSRLDVEKFNYPEHGNCSENFVKMPEFENKFFILSRYRNDNVKFILQLVNLCSFNLRYGHAFDSDIYIYNNVKGSINYYFKVVHPFCR